MNQREIVWVNVMYSNLRESKYRPAVVVSNNGYNQKSPDVVVCVVTSKLKDSEYGIPIDRRNIESGSLPLKSMIRADKILQVEKGLIAKSFAALDSKTFDSLAGKINKLVKRK